MAIPRLFIRDGFYDNDSSAENVVENVAENVVENFSPVILSMLSGYQKKKRATTISILKAIAENENITISKMAETTGTSVRTVQRYLKEFQDSSALKREGSDIAGKWVLL